MMVLQFFVVLFVYRNQGFIAGKEMQRSWDHRVWFARKRRPASGIGRGDGCLSRRAEEAELSAGSGTQVRLDRSVVARFETPARPLSATGGAGPGPHAATSLERLEPLRYLRAQACRRRPDGSAKALLTVPWQTAKFQTSHYRPVKHYEVRGFWVRFPPIAERSLPALLPGLVRHASLVPARLRHATGWLELYSVRNALRTIPWVQYEPSRNGISVRRIRPYFGLTEPQTKEDEKAPRRSGHPRTPPTTAVRISPRNLKRGDMNLIPGSKYVVMSSSQPKPVWMDGRKSPIPECRSDQLEPAA